MDPKLLAMLVSAGHMMFAEEPGGKGGSTTQPASEDPAPGDGEQTQGDPAELGEPGKKALAAERKRADDAVKALKVLEAQVQAKEDASLTETQRLKKQLDDLTAAHAQTQLEATRNRVIATEEVPASLADFVSGEDEAAMVASAQALKAALADASKPGTPAPDPSQGAHPPVDAVAHSKPGTDRLAAAFEQQLSTRK